MSAFHMIANGESWRVILNRERQFARGERGGNTENAQSNVIAFATIVSQLNDKRVVELLLFNCFCFFLCVLCETSASSAFMCCSCSTRGNQGRGCVAGFGGIRFVKIMKSARPP